MNKSMASATLIDFISMGHVQAESLNPLLSFRVALGGIAGCCVCLRCMSLLGQVGDDASWSFLETRCWYRRD